MPKAAAQASQLLVKVWQETGVDASELFLVQQLDMVLKEAGRIPSRLHLGEVSVIDNGDGKAIASLLNAYPEMVRQFFAPVGRDPRHSPDGEFVVDRTV